MAGRFVRKPQRWLAWRSTSPRDLDVAAIAKRLAGWALRIDLPDE
jgi:hypothetical protein